MAWGLSGPQLQQSQGTEQRKGVEICENEVHEIPGSKGTAHFIMKWDKQDKKVSTVNIEHVKKFTRGYMEDDSNQFVPIVGFDCRGAEPVDWTPQVRGLGWTGNSLELLHRRTM